MKLIMEFIPIVILILILWIAGGMSLVKKLSRMHRPGPGVSFAIIFIGLVIPIIILLIIIITFNSK